MRAAFILWFTTLFFFTGCSSGVPKSFKVNDLEKRADEYIMLGDRFRLQGRGADAVQYYRSAQQIYFKKWEMNKYALAGMKECAILILQGDLDIAKERFAHFQNYLPEIKDLNVEADLMLTRAMLLYAQNEPTLAEEILDKWNKNDSVVLEKRLYMHFYRIWKSQKLPHNMTIDDLKSEVAAIEKKYDDGSLLNPEVAFFATLATAEFLEKEKLYDEAWKLAQSVIRLHREAEVTTQWPRIFLLCSRLAQAMNKVELAAYYRRAHEEQLKVILP